MEIKRTTEIFIETHRQFFVRQLEENASSFFCPVCGEPMLAAEQIAGFFRLSRRAVYQMVENETVHYAEIETGAVMICALSLTTFVEGEKTQSPAV